MGMAIHFRLQIMLVDIQQFPHLETRQKTLLHLQATLVDIQQSPHLEIRQKTLLHLQTKLVAIQQFLHLETRQKPHPLQQVIKKISRHLLLKIKRTTLLFLLLGN
jgi:hypothetical protein